MHDTHLEHQFVEYIPEHLEQGVLYISVKYATAIHRCCCGCGEEVVTPFSPTDWKMVFDGATVSLWPSIGNWNFSCRSHYIIRRGRVIEAGNWTNHQVESKRHKDKTAKGRYYSTLDPANTVKPTPNDTTSSKDE
jgi:Family of unknown function (DUF6527)